MDRIGEWRLIEAEEPEDGPSPAPTAAVAPPAGSGRLLLTLVTLAVLAVAGAAIWMTLPQPGVQLDIRGQAAPFDPLATGGATDAVETQPLTSPAVIVVDVEGAVVRPGLHRLPIDSRVGDAITAAGGYSPQVDIGAAASALNLAEKLADGAKVHVPLRGEGSAAAPATTEAATPGQLGGGLIDVNQAGADELDTLPGIGPVTAAKIIAAREEAPFGTVDDLLARGVVGQSTFDKIRDLITVAP